MKGIFLFIALCLGTALAAQDCSQFYYLQNNKTVVMTMFNKKDKETGRVTYKMSDVKTAAGVTSSTVNSEMRDEKGKLLSSAVTKMQCSKGVFLCDMSLLIPPAQMEQLKSVEASSAIYLEYPNGMQAGDALKDGNFSVSGANNMTLQVSITERKVEAKETVTTPAGTWDCLRISSKQKLTTKIGAMGIPITLNLLEWFAPGVGVVKTETKMGKTELTSIQ